jgi:ABC-2 type transport system ATP-binding protein
VDDSVLVDIHNLTKVFLPGQPPALSGIHAVVPKGKIVGLVGSDAAGKTTLMRLIAGILVPTEGTITVAGFDSVTQAEEIHKITGYMPQRFGLYEDLSVIQNLNLFADLRGVQETEREATFARLLHFTGLEPFTKRLARDLSGGMKQKLGLACTLIQKPTLLLLDEPSVGVDPISRRELWKMTHELIKEGMSVIWSTAYLDEAERCDSVLLLNEGKLLFAGPPGELTQKVKDRVFKLTQIVGSRRQLLFEALKDPRVLDGVIQGSDVRLVMKTAEAPVFAGQAVTIAVPPRFEDAFIDMLGGGPGGESQLATMRPIPEVGTEKVIVAEHLTKKFGSFTAVNDVSFEVKRGEIFGLLGPNGAGKSTTFKMLCGLLPPTSGRAFVNGVDLQVAPGKARSHIGYMAQKFSLYGALSVYQNLDFFGGIYNLKGSRKSAVIDQMVKIFNLTPFLDTSAETLPLGYKQRLALSCANLHYPETLFLDEPTSGVDPITRREFWSHINSLVEKGVTVMVTTHFMDEAEYCDRIALIYRGQIIQMGSPDELKEIAKTEENPTPTLEDAFIKLIQEDDAKQPA